MSTGNVLYQQKLQEAQDAYNKMKEQYNKTQAVEKQMKDWENHIAQLKKDNPQVQGTGYYNDLKRQLDESKQKILNLIPENANVPNDFLKSSVKQIEKIVHGIRLILSRKQSLQNSIEFLEKEEQTLISEKGDLQNYLSISRKWVSEQEEELIKENQKVRNDYSNIIQKIQEDEKQYKEEIKRLSDKSYQVQNQSYELEFLTSQAQKQIDNLQNDISGKISSLPAENQKLVQDMLDSINSLKERSEQYNEIIKSSKYLNVINNGTKILTNEANSLVQEYNTRKEHFQQLCTQEIPKIQKDNEGIQSDLEEQKKNFDELNNQVQSKEKQKQTLIEQIKTLEDNRTELLVKQEKADSSSRFGKPYREATNKIKIEDEYIQAQKKDLDAYKKLCDTFGKDIQKLKSNSSDLKKIFDQEEKDNSELLSKLDEKYTQIVVEFNQKQKEIEKTINRILRSNPEGSKIDTSIDSNASYCHGYTLLPKFEQEHATYDIDTEKNETSINLASKDTLLDLIFFNDINQSNTGYLPQLLLIWHQNRFPMNEFADSINQRLKNQLAGQPIIPNLTNAEAFECCNKLFTQWEIYFKHDFYNADTRKSLLEMLESMKYLTEDEDNKDNINHNIEIINKNYDKDPVDENMLFDKLDEKIKDNSETFTPLKLEPKSIAYHFMYIDLNNFQQIEPYEFVKGAWSKPGKETNAKHIYNLTLQFNKTAKIVLNTILTAALESKKETKDEINKAAINKAAINKAAIKRAKIIEAWIEVMKAAKEIKDYNLIFEIDAAFTNPAISKKKLPYTYEKVKPELLKAREELSNLTAPNQKFKAYKASLEKEDPEISLLYMGPWQTEMTFIDDGNKSSIPLPSGEDALNCKKQQAYFKQLAFLRKGWGKKFREESKFKLNENVLNQIVNYKLVYADDASLRQAAADTHEQDLWNKEHP